MSFGNVALLSLIFLSVMALSFYMNKDCLYWEKDGISWVIQGKTQLEFKPLFDQVGVSPFEGNFDSYFPIAREYFIATLLQIIIPSGLPFKIITYTIYAAFLVVCAYIMARTFGFDRLIALLGAWLLPLAIYPAFVNEPSRFYVLFSIVPDHSQIVGFSMLIVAALWGIDAKRRATYPLILAPAACLMIVILGVATYMPLMVLGTALYGGASLLEFRDRRSLVLRGLAIGLIVIVPLTLGTLHYLYGLFRYTAFQFFAQEFLQTRSDNAFASTFWWGSYGRWAISLGLLGAAMTALMAQGRLRLVALVHIGITVLFQVIAFMIINYAPNYKGISPVYLETCLWPYSLMFAASGLVTALRLVLRLVERIAGGRRLVGDAFLAPGLLLAFLGGVVGANASTAMTAGPSPCRGFSPIAATPITKTLQQAIAIRPGARFSGLAATVTGVNDKARVSWQDLHLHDLEIWQATGNDHRMPGLWNFGVPTLIQYGSFITPPYYLMLSQLLSRTTDLQERGAIVISRRNDAIMRLLGVRYVIAEGQRDGDNVVAQMPSKGGSLRLIELPDPNLGNFSPTQVRQVNSFQRGMEFLQDPQFDARREVITVEPLADPLVEGTLGALTYESDGFRISGHSEGESVFVLPVQFSHCWTVRGDGPVSLFRADLALMGIRFRGRLDAKLTFRYGPIYAGGCRLRDLRDMTALDVGAGRTTSGRP